MKKLLTLILAIPSFAFSASIDTKSVPQDFVAGSSLTLESGVPLLLKTGSSLTIQLGVTVTGLLSSNVGLGNVPNVDATNATNITSGTLPAARLPNTVVTPGSYTKTNLTVGADGRLTAASNGTGGDGGGSGTWRDGNGVPLNTLGLNGDYYLNDLTGDVYLKSSGTYSIVANITGPAGSAGATGSAGTNGTNGTNGVDGKTVRNGSGTPSSGLGVDGDFYIDTAANAVYGPKTSGAWGSSTSLIGPTGATGATGPVFNTGHLVYVDAVNGNDSTAILYREDKPYLTPSAAKTAASAGDTIVVFPGTYNDHGLTKNGVNWYFFTGATITNALSIFDDSSGSANFNVDGDGDFISTGVNVPVVKVAGSTSVVHFTANSAKVTGQNTIWVAGGELHVTASVLSCPSGDVFYWTGGNLFVDNVDTATGLYFVDAQVLPAGVHGRINAHDITGAINFAGCDATEGLSKTRPTF